VQGRELTHESAVLHVTGEAVYTDDLPNCAARCTQRWCCRPWPMAS
jgi:xanthine dehydrogenase molybdopterin-binding subunit B